LTSPLFVIGEDNDASLVDLTSVDFVPKHDIGSFLGALIHRFRAESAVEGNIIFFRGNFWGREDIEKNAFTREWAFFECPTIVP
jgi:hypothetical protein